MAEIVKTTKCLDDRSETKIVREILRYLTTAPDVIAWRNNVGAMMAESKYGVRRFVRFGMKGQSDITGIVTKRLTVFYKDKDGMVVHTPLGFGQRLEIEVKRPGKQPTVHQRAFLEMVRKAGGIGIVASSVEDVRKELEIAFDKNYPTGGITYDY